MAEQKTNEVLPPLTGETKPPAGSESNPEGSSLESLLALVTSSQGGATGGEGEEPPPAPAVDRTAALASLGMTEEQFAEWATAKKAEPASAAPADHTDIGAKKIPGAGMVPQREVGGEDFAAAADVVTAIPKGAYTAAKETVKFAAQFTPGNLVGAMIGDKDLQASSTLVADSIPDAPQPETIAGQMAKGVTQFTVGMIGFGKLLKAQQVLQGTGAAIAVGRSTLQGALTDASVFDPLEGRLSNLVEEYPSLHNPITDFLSAKPDDGQAEGRLKNALEGAVIGNALEGLMAAVRGVKRVRLTRAAKGDEAGAKELEKVLDEVEVAGQPKAPESVAADPVAVEAPKAPEATQGTPKPSDGLEPSAQPGQNGLPEVPPQPKQVLDQAEVDDVISSLKDDYDPEAASGLWNQAKIDAEGGVRQALEATAKKVFDQVNAKTGGVQTWKETAAKSAEMADAFGQKPEEFMVNLAQLAKGTDEQAALVYTARRMQNGIAKEIQAEARKLDSGLSTDKTAINAAIQKLAELEGYLAPIRTAQARGTRQWGMVADDMMSAQAIKSIIASGGDPRAVTKIVKGMKPLGIVGKVIASFNFIRINGMLLNTKTHIRNFAGNTFMLLSRPAEKAVGGAIEGALSKVPGASRWLSTKNGGMTEGLAEYIGMQHAFIDSIKMAAKSAKLDKPILSASTMFDEKTNLVNIWGANKDSIAGMALGMVDKVMGVSSRLLVAHDEFFQQMNSRAMIYAKATREGVDLGKVGQDLADYVAQRSDDAFEAGEGSFSDVASRETTKVDGRLMDEDVLRETKISTFQEPITNVLGKGVEQLANSHPVWRIPLTFVKSPFNIIKQTLHRTPGVNLLLNSYREDLAAGGMRRTQAIGKMAMGAMYWSTATYLATSGKTTGRGPKSQQQRDAMMATGWRPYSFKTENGYVPYADADPASSFFGMAADMAEVIGHADEEDAKLIAFHATAALVKNFSDKSYARSLSEALDAVTDPDRDFERWYRSQVSAMVPGVIRQVGSKLPGGSDPVMREVRSTMDAIRVKTPYLSDNHPPKRNALGEEITYPVGAGPDSISPFYFSPNINDAVKEELARIEGAIGMPSEKIADGRINLVAFVKNGQDAYDRMGELRLTHKLGRFTLRESVVKLIESKAYQDMNDGNNQYDSPKALAIQQVFGRYQEAIEAKVYKAKDAEYPDLHEAFVADQVNKGIMAKPNRNNSPLEELLKPLTAP